MPNIRGIIENLTYSLSNSQFKLIENLINKFELDSRGLLPEEFVIIENEEIILGFGRIREHASCSELCSLGVIEPKRFKGYGKRLVTALIKKATKPLYLVCIIPDYFRPFGFELVSNYPLEMQEKINYCNSELSVPEKYVVMKFNPNGA